MAAELGAQPRVCAPVGGRSGALLPELMRLDGVDVVPVPCHRSSAVWVSTGRDGEPATVGATEPPPLDRHEVDGLYSATLAAGLAAGIAVLTGPPRLGILPVDVYRRLARDLSANGAGVIADVGMEALEPTLAGGIDVLKVSDEDLIQAGRLRERALEGSSRRSRTSAPSAPGPSSSGARPIPWSSTPGARCSRSSRPPSRSSTDAGWATR
jgi:1-phosphofructokinase